MRSDVLAPSELEGTDYLLSSTMRLEDSFLQILGVRKFLSETEARIRRTTLNIRQDQALHELRLRREQVLITRENNLLEYEQRIHNLQIEKMELEIELIKKQIEN